MAYTKYCPECNAEQTYSRAQHYNAAVRLNKLCRGCANRLPQNNGHMGFYNDIRISWFKQKQRDADARNILWDLTLEQLWDLYLAQEQKCSLSGLPIAFQDTLSIDRIDSNLDYTISNVQLVHKDINFMKQQFSQEHFINMCCLIAKHNKDY